MTTQPETIECQHCGGEAERVPNMRSLYVCSECHQVTRVVVDTGDPRRTGPASNRESKPL